MHHFLFATLLGTTTLVAQQIPIPAFSVTSTAPLTRGFWFQAPVDFVITGLRVPNEAGQPVQTVEVIDLGTQAPPSFPATTLGTQLFYAHNQPSNQMLTTSIAVTAGHCIGILGGCGTSTLASSFAVAGTYASNVLGYPITLTRFGTQTNIHTTGGNQPVWSEAAGQIARIEVTVAPSPNYAYGIRFGSGCYDSSRSFYEVFAAPTAFDLAGRAMTGLWNGSYYTFVQVGAFVPPSPAAAPLGLGDDTEASVSLSAMLPCPGGSTGGLTICSNGYVSVTTGNGTAYQPSPTAWLASLQPRWGLVHDLNPASSGSGQVVFEEVGGVAYVTWNGVHDYGVASPGNGNTFQLQFDLPSGNVTYAWVAMTGLGNGILVGHAGGGGSRDLGNFDISTHINTSFAIGAADLFAPQHSSNGRPRLGATISLDTGSIAASCALGATVLGFTEYTAGIPLASIGMPDCAAYASPDALVVFLPIGGIATQPLTVPATPNLAGAIVVSQALTLVPGVNPLGAMTSNGLRLMLNSN